MSDSTANAEQIFGTTHEEILEALFADLVARQTNLALMFMGYVKDPQSGKANVDLEAARMFIDQLEMLAIKTDDNLSKPEAKFLQDSLTHVRLAFVKASERSAAAEPAPAAESDAAAETKVSK